MPPHTSNLRNLTNPHVSARWLRLLLLPNTYAWLLPTTGFRSSITAHRAPTRIRRAKRPTRNSQPSPAQPISSRRIASQISTSQLSGGRSQLGSARLDSTRPEPARLGRQRHCCSYVSYARPTSITPILRLLFSASASTCPVSASPRLASPSLSWPRPALLCSSLEV